MGILQFFLLCVVIGLVVWLIQSFAPIPPQIKTLILWVAVVFLLVVLLNAMGLFGHDIAIPKLR